MKRIFSTTIIVATLLYVVWYFMPFAWEYLYDNETLGGLQWNGYGAKLNLDGPIPYIAGIAYLVSALGMLFYKLWARTLFTLLTISTVISAPFWGVAASGGYDVLVGNIVTLSDGAIIAMAYLTSVSSEFKQSA